MLQAALLALAASTCTPGQWCTEGAGYRPGYVLGIEGTATDDVWAWGFEGQLHHWQGTSWTATQLPTREKVNTVRAFSRTSAIALAGKKLFRWDGKSWEPWLELPNAVYALWGASPDDLWLFGLTVHRVRAGVVTDVPFGPGFLYSADGTSSNDVWAMGRDSGGTVVAHWDGKSLSRELLPYRSEVGSIRAVGREVFIATSDSLLRRTGKQWTPHQPVNSEPRLGRGAFTLVLDKKALLPLGPRGKAHPTLPEGELSAAWARAPDDIWVGGAGLLVHWDGKRWSGGERVSRGELQAVSGNAEGEVWATDGREILRRKGGAWTPIQGPESHLSRAIFSAGPADTWVSTAAGPARWDGSRWQTFPLSDAGVLWLWGSGRDDVWAVGRGAFHWDGTSWTLVQRPKEHGSFTHVVGDGKGTVWILEEVPRPSGPDGPGPVPSDEVLELRGSASRRLSPGDRVKRLAWAQGALWALGDRRPLQRFDGTKWVHEKAFANDRPHSLVQTRSGLMILSWDYAWVRRGEAWEKAGSFAGAMVIDAWSDGTQVFAVGRDGLLMRWVSP